MNIKSLFSLGFIFTTLTISTGFVTPSPTLPSEITDVDRSFVEFLSYFEKVDNNFSISLNDIQKYENLKISQSTPSKNKLSKASLVKYIPELEARMYSRMGPPKVVPVSRFYPNEETIAVIYMTYQPFRSVTDMDFHLTFFDLNGNNLPKQKKEDFEFGKAFHLASINHKVTQTFSLSKEGFIWKNTFSNLRKEDVKKKGLAGNEIVGYDFFQTEVFQIKGNGIVELATEYPVDSKASLD
jgi:hypothetical protein